MRFILRDIRLCAFVQSCSYKEVGETAPRYFLRRPGSKRSPAKWSRRTMFLKWVATAPFGIPITVYADEVFIIEPPRAIRSAFDTYEMVCRLFGFKLDETKEDEQNNTTTLRRSDITIAKDRVAARLPNQKNDTPCEIKRISGTGTLPPPRRQSTAEVSDLANQML